MSERSLIQKSTQCIISFIQYEVLEKAKVIYDGKIEQKTKVGVCLENSRSYKEASMAGGEKAKKGCQRGNHRGKAG